MSAFNYQLLLKHILQQGIAWAPDQEIVYRDQVRHTYSTMYQRVLRLGAALQGLGVKEGTRVGVIEWDSHRYLEMYFGIPGIGAVLHTINPRLAPDDLLYTVAHAEDEVLIFHEDFLPLVERIHASVPTIRKYILITDKREEPMVKWADSEYEQLLAGAIPLAELPELDENSIATQSYTTGTTGKPKGVYFTQRQLTLQALSTTVTVSGLGNYEGISKRDVYMPLTPMFHVHAWGIPYVAMMLGLKQVYPGKYEPPMLLKLILGEKVTFSHCVPTILQSIVSAPAVKGMDLSRWKVVIGGAMLPKGLAMDAAKLGIKVYAGYGMSETAPVISISNLKPFMETWDEEKKLDRMIMAGTPIPLVDVQVWDASGKPVAHNGKETGEVVVRAPWCTAAYYKEPERSTELWAGDWMHTGDVATLDQYGYIQIVDRLKDIIKSGGEWIVSLEVENLLSMQEGVSQVAVIGVPDEKWGERPLAIIVPREGYKDKLTPEALKAHLTKYVDVGVIMSWSVPDDFVMVDQIPMTSVGKHDKKLLRSKYAEARQLVPA